MKRKTSLKKMIVFFMMTCWILPILVLFIFIHTSYKSAYLDRTENLIEEGVKNSAILLSSRIDEGINLLQKPSYDRNWERAWLEYQEEKITKHNFLFLMRESLKSNFYLDDRFDSYAFYMVGEEIPACYSSRSGYSYHTYQEYAKDIVNDLMERDSSYPEVHVIDNRIFLLRNLYTVSDYQKFGTLVVSMNSTKIFDGFPLERRENLVIGLNGTDELLYLEGEESWPGEETGPMYEKLYQYYEPDTLGRLYKENGDGYNGYSYQRKQDNYSLGFFYVVSHRLLKESLYDLYRVIYGMLLIFVPILFYAVYFIKNQIETPLGQLVEASGAIRDGKIGTVIKDSDMPNLEFDCLVESFNNMSEQVKYLFDTVYNEKLARKDAQIAALQAQINPHFLNNTLEMMNWQARMNHDNETSSMIEALGIVLDHSINRTNEKEIYLSEELRCADAYLYIMSMRFGQRLKVEREIDEALLQTMVPQLILQPLIENAIMHGIEVVKQGTIRMEVHHDDEYLYLDVINTGRPIEPQKLKRIQAIMDGVYVPEPGERGKHTSIGIRNVNHRIKLVYGEEYGLTITSLEDGRTMSRIIVPFCEDAQREMQK